MCSRAALRLDLDEGMCHLRRRVSSALPLRCYAEHHARSSYILVLLHPACIRACPGQALADASVWLAIASTMALFDILKPLDDSGKEYMPPAKFISAFARSAFMRR